MTQASVSLFLARPHFDHLLSTELCFQRPAQQSVQARILRQIRKCQAMRLDQAKRLWSALTELEPLN